MRAAVYDRYGTFPDIRDVPRPEPGPRDLLVRVHAASVNSWDWDEYRGWLANKRKPPKHPILGADLAGVVEAVGAEVTRFKPGDAVMADLCEGGWGGFGEYVAGDEKWFAAKPDTMGFEEAAALPQAGKLALQSLRLRPVSPGERVLINGAGGGVGSFAIQMAKRLGAVVTAVDSGAKLDFMRGLGADHVVDYAVTDFAALPERHDLVIDLVARRSSFAHRRVLAPGGRYVMVGGTFPRIIDGMVLAPLVSRFGSRKLGLLFYAPNAEDLAELAGLHGEGLNVVIDAVYPLEQVADALRHVGGARVRGKVVVRVAG